MSSGFHVAPSSLREYSPHVIFVGTAGSHILGLDSTTFNPIYRLPLPDESFPCGASRVTAIPDTRLLAVSAQAAPGDQQVRYQYQYYQQPQQTHSETSVAVFEPEVSPNPLFVRKHHRGTISGLAGLPGTSSFASPRLVSGDSQGDICVCNAETGENMAKVTVEGDGPKGSINCLMCVPKWDPSEIYIGSATPSAHCYDLSKESLVRTFTAAPNAPRWRRSVDVIAGDVPGGRNLFVMSSSGTTSFFSRTDAQYVMEKSTTPVHSICLALDRFLMVCASSDRLVGVWDLRRLGRAVTLFQTVRFGSPSFGGEGGGDGYFSYSARSSEVSEVERVDLGETALFVSVCGNGVSMWNALSGKIRHEKLLSTGGKAIRKATMTRSVCVMRDEEEDSELARSVEDRLRFVMETYQTATVRMPFRSLPAWVGMLLGGEGV